MAYECHSPQIFASARASGPCLGLPVLILSNMAAASERIRNVEWKDNQQLREDLEKYVRQNLKRREILDYMVSDYPQYAWSLRSLARRLQYFEITFVDYDIDLHDVKDAVKRELDGPGKLLGYRAMHQKIREIHGLNAPRDLVYAVMTEADPEGLKGRGGIGKPKRPRRTNAFVCGGANCTMSLDGHDKLCGYQKSMFPLSIYGGLDTYSGRVNFLRVWTTNNDPKVIGRIYFDYIFESRVLPQTLRIDRGTETDLLSTIHCFLRQGEGDLDDVTDSIIYGPSTQNKIERFWKELLERMERFFKEQLKSLVENGEYDSTDQNDRDLLAYVYVPIVQKELDVFRECIWNNHRTRKQKGKELPSGVPEHIFNFPENYGGRQCGIQITEEQLLDVAEVSGILDDTDDYLSLNVRREFERNSPDIGEIEAKDAMAAYLYLKAHMR